MRILSLLTVSAAVVCAQPQRTSPVVIENEHVRVLKVVDVPKGVGRVHEHAMNRVMIYLNPGHLMIRYEDGKIDDQKVKAGEVRWSKAGGRHSSENVGPGNVEIVEVELKSKPGGDSKPITASLDPVKLHPAQYKILFENDQVRVLRVRLDPKMKVKQHEHTVNRVQVFLSDFSVRVTAPDAKVSEIARKAGDTAFAGPAKHAEENLLATAGEIILVELKK